MKVVITAMVWTYLVIRTYTRTNRALPDPTCMDSCSLGMSAYFDFTLVQMLWHLYRAYYHNLVVPPFTIPLWFSNDGRPSLNIHIIQSTCSPNLVVKILSVLHYVISLLYSYLLIPVMAGWGMVKNNIHHVRRIYVSIVKINVSPGSLNSMLHSISVPVSKRKHSIGNHNLSFVKQ